MKIIGIVVEFIGRGTVVELVNGVVVICINVVRFELVDTVDCINLVCSVLLAKLIVELLNNLDVCVEIGKLVVLVIIVELVEFKIIAVDDIKVDFNTVVDMLAEVESCASVIGRFYLKI